ncbi:MAG: hypothetical protein Ct9H300mP5_2460 [Candidatus Pelagibacterales bacterium]|nr:MAG: hypothetical protein Ct9H300mP5_2460 [Pelagibacterales bacterium]
MILMKFIANISMKKHLSNQADVHNAGSFLSDSLSIKNNIPDWLKLTAEGRLQEAYELAQSTNNMPEVWEEFVLKIDL